MAREHGVSEAARRAGAALGVSAAAAQFLPSVAVLGQWSALRTLPAGLCRWQGPRFPPNVALTFDDGPDPEQTPRVLDALDELDLRATFFVLGEQVRRQPELVAEIARRGHQLGTHGDQHAHHLLRSPAWVRRDLRRALETLRGLGHAPRWYRPPYGQATGATLVLARTLGLRTVLWSAWGREWASAAPAEVAARITRRLGPGAVVLLHDSDRAGTPGMSRLALDALPLVAEELRRRHLDSVTLDELIG